MMRIGEALSGIVEICYKPLGEKGEDAFAYSFARPDIHAQAVFDGCGGAGAWKYPEFRDASGAFVAAQSVAKRFQSWADGLTPASLRDPQRAAASFQQAAGQLLKRMKGGCRPMGVSGSMVKSFPCTASIAIAAASGRGGVALTALNAGDSRVYFLTPERGLVQLTTDDSRGAPDPLQSLRDSPPLSNLLNADKPFKLSARRVELPLPCAILCATDGMFGYLRSPMDFEYLLLDSIEESKSIAEFEERFEGAVREATGDDSTCVAAFYGWESYGAIRGSLRKRRGELERWIREIDAAGDDFAAAERIIARQWEDYKRQAVCDQMRGQ